MTREEWSGKMAEQANKVLEDFYKFDTEHPEIARQLKFDVLVNLQSWCAENGPKGE